MTVQSESVAHSELVDGGVTSLHTHSTEGAGPVLQGTVLVNPPNISKTSSLNIDVSVSGILTTHKIYVQCQSDLEYGLVHTAAYCPVNGTLRVRLSNLSQSSIDGGERIWGYQAYA